MGILASLESSFLGGIMYFFIRLLFFLIIPNVSSLDESAKARCPTNKPYKCPPYNYCYDLYSYCSLDSRRPELCYEEHILNNTESRFGLCQNIITQVKNISETVRDKSCNLVAACVSEFRTHFFPENKPQAETDHSWTLNHLSILLLIIVIILVVLIIVIVIICITKKRTIHTELNEVTSNDHSSVPVRPNRKRENVFAENDGQTTAVESEGDEIELLLQRQTSGDENAGNLPDDLEICTPSTVNDTPPIVSVANITQGRQSFDGSTGSSESQQRQESSSTASIEHPAEIENRQLRGIHMANTEPSDVGQLMVTSKSQYNHE